MGEGLVELVFIEKFSFPGTAVELGLHQVLAVLRSLEAGAEAGGYRLGLAGHSQDYPGRRAVGQEVGEGPRPNPGPGRRK